MTAPSADERSTTASAESATARERVRELLQAEVDKQGALDDTRRAAVLIGEGSIRFSEEPEPGFVIVGPDGQPRTSVRDGRAVPFTLADLAAELRRHYPALFRPDSPDAAATTPSSEPAKMPPARDWLMVDSGGPGPTPEPDLAAEAARQTEDVTAAPAPAPAPAASIADERRGTMGEQGGDTGAADPPIAPVAPVARKQAERELVPDILPPVGVFRPSYAIYGGLALLIGTILALLVTLPDSETATTSASDPPPKVAASPPAAAPPPINAKPPGALSGVPEVVDTSTLRIDGRIVRLFGVEWERGAQAEDLTRYLAGREVICTPVARSDRHRCVVEGRDLSEVVLYNGGGRATAEATPELKAAEAKARAGGLGVWQKP